MSILYNIPSLAVTEIRFHTLCNLIYVILNLNKVIYF